MNWQAVADAIRTIAVPVSAFVAVICARVVVDHRYRSGTQLFRFLGLGLLSIGLAFGQYHALGKPPFWPSLIMVDVAQVLSLAGTLPLVLHMRSKSLTTKPGDEEGK